MIDVRCRECGLHVQIGDSFAGRKGKCPKCGQVLKIGLAAPQQTAQPPGKSAAPQPASKAPAAESTRPPDKKAAGPAQPARKAESDPIPFDSLGDEEPTAHVEMPNKARLGDEAASQSGISKATAPAAGIHHGDGTDAHVPTHLDMLSHYLVCNHKDIIARWESDGRSWQVRLKDGFARATTCAAHIPQVGKFLLIEIGVERREDGFHIRNVTAFRLQEHYALTKLVHGDDQVLATVTGVAELTPRQRAHVRALVRQKFLPHIWPELDELLPDIQDSSGM